MVQRRKFPLREGSSCRSGNNPRGHEASHRMWPGPPRSCVCSCFMRRGWRKKGLASSGKQAPSGPGAGLRCPSFSGPAASLPCRGGSTEANSIFKVTTKETSLQKLKSILLKTPTGYSNLPSSPSRPVTTENHVFGSVLPLPSNHLWPLKYQESLAEVMSSESTEAPLPYTS